jgi:hypothetical protein
MKYPLNVGSDVVIFIPSFIKTGSDVQKLMGLTQTGRKQP